MVDRVRCKVCGYYHLGPTPEKCPVCGAGASAFLPYDGPADLTGTKTLENLKAAFAGESQANRRYTLWSRIAALEGASEAVEAFEHAAAEETAHALGHLAYIAAATATADNLKAAIDGEDHEFTQMYPKMADEAEAEGFEDIAMYFRNVQRYEGKHRDAYRAALDKL